MADRKRQRSLSSDSSSDSSYAGSDAMDLPSPPGSPRRQPAPKYHRAPEAERTHLCVLPPTCSQPDTAQAFATLDELEAHQAAFHRWICHVPIRDKPGRVGEGEPVVMPEQFAGRAAHSAPGPSGQRWRECGKAFPDERLLDLHHTETHDPIARERQERGEKIFACFLPPDQCSKIFLTPKKRRQHLIEKHHFPVAYFFSITNHGLNQIARTEGPAASLIRPRVDRPPAPAALDAKPSSSTSVHRTSHAQGHGNDGDHGHVPHLAPIAGHNPGHQAPIRAEHDDMDMDALAAKMATLESSLTFVPRNVRRRARDVSRKAMELV